MDVGQFLNALPEAATNPLALAAYAITLGTSAFLGFRITRNRNLLNRIEKLPEVDRLKALQVEMNTVLPKNISAEQWLRARSANYKFVGFVVLIICLLIVAVVALTIIPAERDRNISGAATLYNAALARTPTEDASSTGGGDFRTIKYRTELVKGREHIFFENGYLQKLSRGEVVGGFTFFHHPFETTFPILSLQIVNNSRLVSQVTGLEIAVKKSSIIRQPILLVRENRNLTNSVELWNEGWSPAEGTQLLILGWSEAPDFFPLRWDVEGYQSECVGGKFKYPDGRLLSVGTITEPTIIKVGPVPAALERKAAVCMYSQVIFGPKGKRKTFNTANVVPQGIDMPQAVSPVSATYDVALKAGKAPKNYLVPVAHTIAPSGADHLLLRVGSDMSADYEIVIAAASAVKRKIPLNEMALKIFVPRSSSKEGAVGELSALSPDLVKTLPNRAIINKIYIDKKDNGALFIAYSEKPRPQDCSADVYRLNQTLEARKIVFDQIDCVGPDGIVARPEVY